MALDKSVRINVTPFLGSRTVRNMNVSEEQLVDALKACVWDWHDVVDDPDTVDVDEFEVAKASYELVFSLYDALMTKYDKNLRGQKKVKELFNAHAPEKHRLP